MSALQFGPVFPALVCSSTSALLTDPLRRSFRPPGAGRRSRHRLWSWARVLAGVPSPDAGHAPSVGPAGPVSLVDSRPVLAVLTPGRPPERVVAEAAALAARRSSPLVFLVLRRSVGFSTDAALVAAAERAASTAQRELIARAAAALPHPAFTRATTNQVTRAELGIDIDVVRVAGSDFDAPSPWVSRRVLSTARRWHAGVIVLPAVLLGPDSPPRSVTVVPVEDIHVGNDPGSGSGSGSGSGPVAGPGRRMQVRPRPVPDPAPGPDRTSPDGPRHHPA